MYYLTNSVFMLGQSTLRFKVIALLHYLNLNLNNRNVFFLLLLLLLLLRNKFAHFTKIAVTYSFFKLGG